MSWIQTFTGKKVFPLAMTTDMVDIKDIAHALSLKCRFTGHCRTFYSVAEHSMRVAELVRPELKLAALLHDAAEAYLPDFARPIKGEAYFVIGKVGRAVLGHVEVAQRGDPLHINTRYGDRDIAISIDTGMYAVSDVEQTILGTIAQVFGFLMSDVNCNAVKQADMILLATEARDLMYPPPENWDLDTPLLPALITPMPPREAEIGFLTMFEQLVQGKPL